MKQNLSRSIFLTVALALAASPLGAADDKAPAAAAKDAAAAKSGQLIRVTDKHAAWAEKERGAYPLKVCVTSDEELGSMGKPAEFIYRVEGQADRLVRFCCAGCSDDFMQDPAKFVAKLDAAKTKSSSAPKSSAK